VPVLYASPPQFPCLGLFSTRFAVWNFTHTLIAVASLVRFITAAHRSWLPLWFYLVTRRVHTLTVLRRCHSAFSSHALVLCPPYFTLSRFLHHAFMVPLHTHTTARSHTTHTLHRGFLTFTVASPHVFCLGSFGFRLLILLAPTHGSSLYRFGCFSCCRSFSALTPPLPLRVCACAPPHCRFGFHAPLPLAVGSPRLRSRTFYILRTRWLLGYTGSLSPHMVLHVLYRSRFRLRLRWVRLPHQFLHGFSFGSHHMARAVACASHCTFLTLWFSSRALPTLWLVASA